MHEFYIHSRSLEIVLALFEYRPDAYQGSKTGVATSANGVFMIKFGSRLQFSHVEMKVC